MEWFSVGKVVSYWTRIQEPNKKNYSSYTCPFSYQSYKESERNTTLTRIPPQKSAYNVSHPSDETSEVCTLNPLHLCQRRVHSRNRIWRYEIGSGAWKMIGNMHWLLNDHHKHLNQMVIISTPVDWNIALGKRMIKLWQNWIVGNIKNVAGNPVVSM